MSTGRLPSVDGGIQPTIVDAKGDLIVATAADTVSRLAVGSNDQVLTADSTTATGLKWATASSGGMTLLSTTTLSGSSTTISSINQSYVNLLAIISGVQTGASIGTFRLAPNGTTNISAGTGRELNTNFSYVTDYLYFGQSTSRATADSQKFAMSLMINNYASTTARKSFNVFGGYNEDWNIGAFLPVIVGGHIDTTSAISSLVFSTTSGSGFTAGTVLLYGVK